MLQQIPDLPFAPETIRRRGFVCKMHFDENYIIPQSRDRLFRSAIATKNLPHSDRSLELEQSPPSEVGQKRVTHVIKGAPLFSLDREVKRVVYACKFPLCKSAAYRNYRFNKRFFKFPRDQERQQVWRTICNIEPHVRCEDFRVCEDHFEASDFLGSRLLLPFAVPKAVVLNDNGEQVKMSVGPSYNRENQRIQIDLPIIRADKVNRQKFNFENLVQNVNPIKTSLKEALGVLTDPNVEPNIFHEEIQQYETFDNESEECAPSCPSPLPPMVPTNVPPPLIIPSYSSMYQDINHGIIEIGCPTRDKVVEITKPYFKALKSFSLESNSVHEVCRICFRLLKEEEIVKLYDEGPPSQETKELRDMLEFILPELDLELYTNVVVCTKCRDLLAFSYELQHAWMCTEKKLQKVVEEKKSLTNLSSDLVIVTESSVGDVMREHHQDVINVDHDYEKNVENAPVLKRDEVQYVARRILDNIPEDPINVNEDFLTKKKLKFFYRGVNLSSYNLIGFRTKRKEVGTKWGEGPYICEMCAFFTKSLISFQRHLRKHATNKLSGDIPKKKKPRIKSFKCDKCDQLFTSQQHLERHFLKHQTYKCGICEKEFKLNSILRKHVKHVHLKDYNYYQCHLCGKQFCYKDSLRLHFVTHNSVKTVKCDLCPKKFATRVKLTKHLRSVHSDAPPLTCSYCGKSIKNEKNLEKHIQVYHFHQGDICDICGKPFSKKDYLIKHKMRVHGVGTL
ncbi:uncharacterized protein LOC103314758 isoform X3 [Tribolium castaneum]|uniref:uncharacterized protein LOC103314758 isoform X3 n=1 Tax=Tribolium castaneum TaxID=7070 RepID=UPI00077D94C7|nr:PREDICTED: uncharacterized protein LOC103314758 isoform X3 [Tribolium castaneum]|eukprot:XP_015837824.1 PREDICTED: uncharacterized protein LOC103314758 isoform X3 [Tribolium castaneum]